MLNRCLLFCSMFVILPTLVRSQSLVQELIPVEDCFIRTFGGGEGLNTFLEFNISSVPTGKRIDSVLVKAYVWFVGTNWDGDVNFWNVNSQTWRETDSAGVIYRIPTSDSTHQALGFGTAVGWTKSIDVKTIFLVDYNVNRTFCSFKLKDPDDPTRVPMPGSMPNNSSDTLGVGNRAFNQHIFFYPSEYTVDTTRRTRLVVYYSLTGVESQSLKEILHPEFVIGPNPFRGKSNVRCQLRTTSEASLKIYNASGRLVKQFNHLSVSSTRSGRTGGIQPFNQIIWDGANEKGEEVASGVYFFRLEGGHQVHTKKVVKLD